MLGFIPSIMLPITSSPTLMMFTYLGCMVVIGFALWLATRPFVLGLLGLETLNCLNLAICVTQWLDLGVEPFMPLWMSLVLFIVPFPVLVIYRLYFDNGNNGKRSRVKVRG